MIASLQRIPWRLMGLRRTAKVQPTGRQCHKRVVAADLRPRRVALEAGRKGLGHDKMLQEERGL